MLKNLFKKKKQEVNNESLIGKRAVLIHDATVFQYGTVEINEKRYSIKLEDGSELCVGNTVEVVSVEDSHLIVKKVENVQA